jgi:hypothetical protein
MLMTRVASEEQKDDSHTFEAHLHEPKKHPENGESGQDRKPDPEDNEHFLVDQIEGQHAEEVSRLLAP